MIRRRSAAFVLREPPTPDERKALARHRLLQALPAPSEDERAEATQLAAGLTTAETRWTLTALNTLQYGRYEANRRAVIAWIEGVTGKAWAAAVKDDSAGDLIDAGLRWARLAAVVQAVEGRTVNRATDAATDWQPLPATALEGVDAFLEAYTADLAAALDDLVFDLNPGLFGVKLESADAKKNGGTSAS